MRSRHIAASAALVLLCLCSVASVFADMPTFDVDSGPTSAASMDMLYLHMECPAIAALMGSNPIPIGHLDAATGQPIHGWRVYCEGVLVGGGGQTNGTARVVQRACGSIVLYEG